MQESKATGLKKRQLIESAGRTMLVWVAVASVAVSFCIVAFQFLYQQFSFNSKIYDLKSKAASTLTSNIQSAQELQKEVDSMVGNQDLASLRTNPDDAATKVVLDALPGVYDQSALATSLQEAILNRSGVTIESIGVPSAIDESTNGDAIPVPVNFNVVVTGSYDKIMNLVKDLERTIRPMQISSMSAIGNDSELRVTLEVVTYFQPAKSVNIKTKEVR